MVRINYRAIFFKLISWQMFCMTMTVFIAYFLPGIYKDPFYTVLYNAFMTLFYMVLVYNEMWHIGEKDNNMVKHGYAEKEEGRGIKSAFFASIPNIALIELFALNFTPFVNYNVFEALFKFWNVFMVSSIMLISESFYPVYFIVFIPIFIACPLGYANGYQGKSLLGKVMYKGGKKK